MNKQNIISNKEILIYLFISILLSLIEFLIPSAKITNKEMLICNIIVYSYFYIHIVLLLIINFIFKFINIKKDKVKRIIKIILHILATIYVLFLILGILISYTFATANFGQ